MRRVRIWGAACLGLAIGGPVHAQIDDLDVTMTLIPTDAELPDAVTRQIVLPQSAAAEGVENSAEGLATANSRRAAAAERPAAASERRAAGLARAAGRRVAFDAAADARARGADFGAEIGEAARQNRESFIRGDSGLDLPIPDHLPDLPDQRPDLPDLPELPVPPVTPPAGPPT